MNRHEKVGYLIEKISDHPVWNEYSADDERFIYGLAFSFMVSVFTKDIIPELEKILDVLENKSNK